MKKILDFFKSNIIVVKWTAWYFFAYWLILRYIFKFDMFSYHYWWKFFHATFHSFTGFVFVILIYSAIPLYLASVITTYRTKEYAIKIPFLDKIFAFLSKPLKKTEPKIEEKNESTTEPEQNTKPEFPSDMPPELRVPFMRARQRLPLNGAISVYNKQPQKSNIAPEQPEQNEIPIPTDFDVGDAFDEISDSVPTFTDINFDTPIATEQELENETTKYLSKHNIEFETYRDYVATEKYLIYEHNDEDFWVMDGDTWFASGKTKDSPIKELIEIAKQNELTPVIYLASQNIMDIDGTITNFESAGIRIVKNLDELD